MEDQIEHQIPFINRAEEFAHIDALIQEKAWGTRCWLCIHAEGGIGKTRLLEEVRVRYRSPTGSRNITVIDILDFDDNDLHILQNVGRRIATIDEHIFQAYTTGLLDWRKMEMSGISSDRLKDERQRVTKLFVECFNTLSHESRMVLLLDTTEHIIGTDFWDYLADMANQLTNVVILVAGRNTKDIYERLSRMPDPADVLEIEYLKPLGEEDRKAYLEAKKQSIAISLEPDLAEKLLFLTEGRPILLDLAVEWRAHGISLDWVLDVNVNELRSLHPEELKERSKEFKEHLVEHIADGDCPMDWLLLTLARVYPMDVPMIASVLRVSDQEAQELFDEALSYVFVKRRSQDSISLHDEMREILITHAWSKIESLPPGTRQKNMSKRAADYLETKIQVLSEAIGNLQKKEQQTHIEQDSQEGEGMYSIQIMSYLQQQTHSTHDSQAEYTAFVKRERLERQYWMLRIDRLRFLFFSDSQAGFTNFVSMYDEATRSNRLSLRDPMLVTMTMQLSYHELSPEQHYEITVRRIQHLTGEGYYKEAGRITDEALEQPSHTPGQRVALWIERANITIRLGDLEHAIDEFREAVRISEEHHLTEWIIKAKNGLGYAYRMIGDHDEATRLYLEAKDLCLKDEVLDATYGSILNNLTFVLSYQDRRNAINAGKSALEHWKTMNNQIGLAAAHQVLGMVYYQNGLYDEALEELNNALHIFELSREQNIDWVARTLSWRGAVYQGMLRHDEAEKDFEESLAIGPTSIKAMTLCRLGRVYMSREAWQTARTYMQQSYDLSREISDYTYWIASFGRIITIDAATRVYDLFEQHERELHTFLEKVKKPDGNALGIAYFAMARLSLGRQDVHNAIAYLEKGIRRSTTYGMYARTGVVDRLDFVERDFDMVDATIIRQVGNYLKDLFLQEKGEERIAYDVVIPILYKWARWNG